MILEGSNVSSVVIVRTRPPPPPTLCAKMAMPCLPVVVMVLLFAIPGGDGDNTTVTSTTTIAANAHAKALQRAVDRAGERSLAAAAPDALREDAECRDPLCQNRATTAVGDGDGAAFAPGAALTAHPERSLDGRVVSGLVGRTRGAAAAATAADALGIDAVGLGPVCRDRSGVGCVRRTAITGSAALCHRLKPQR